MLPLVRSPDPFLCHLRDGRLFQVSYIHVLSVVVLKIPTITRRQFPRLFQIFHDLRDLPPDKVNAASVASLPYVISQNVPDMNRNTFPLS
jgi:hypothetical protein